MADKYSKQINGYSYYGQHAEDLIISAIFAMIGIDKPSYIDLGTNHPIIDNNTFGMYVNGCRGINIEANPRLIGIIEEKRPEDININVGIGTKDEMLPFYKWDDMSGRNTFCSSEIQYWGGKKPTEIVELQVTTLSTIIDKFCPNGFPDYLDCDIEGMDYDVLESFDLYNDGPKVICVEVKKMQINKFDKMLKSKGYFRFCRIVCNNIYVRDEYSMKLLMFSQEMEESK